MTAREFVPVGGGLYYLGSAEGKPGLLFLRQRHQAKPAASGLMMIESFR